MRAEKRKSYFVEQNFMHMRVVGKKAIDAKSRDSKKNKIKN